MTMTINLYNLPYNQRKELPTGLRKNASRESVLESLRQLAGQLSQISDAYTDDWRNHRGNLTQTRQQALLYSTIAHEIRNAVERLEAK